MTSPHTSQTSTSDDAFIQQPDVAGGHDGHDVSPDLSNDAQIAEKHVQDTMADLTDSATLRARGFAERQKQEGAERVDGAATAVHRAADELADESPLASRYMHAGARQLERASRLLRENSLDELYGMTNRLAHDRPLAFIGGAVAAGFLVARLLRSSGGASAGSEVEPPS